MPPEVQDKWKNGVLIQVRGRHSAYSDSGGGDACQVRGRQETHVQGLVEMRMVESPSNRAYV